ncbi:MAG: cbb3-type cytochrome oxidase assembly protein CcoS [Bacteroidetes bacterium]|nr:cbb3-type cytochrome oxidase assembly protein CcoS [Bacteroidota bacterium]
MEILLLLIAISLAVAITFLIIFIKNAKAGQFDDMYTPAIRILFENEKTTTTDTHGDSNKHMRDSGKE